MIPLGDRLSRWTPVAFACALCNFVVAQAFVVAGVTWPATGLRSGPTLAAVHLLTIGWLTLVMLGALFQFVPVITSQPLLDQRLSAASLVLIEAGLIAMVAGFVTLGRLSSLCPLCLVFGASAVVLGLGLALLNLGSAFLRSGSLTLPGRFVRAGFLFLVATMSLGLVFALSLDLPGVGPSVPGRLAGGVQSHVLAGIGGWLTLTAMGVSYKLLPMFMLSPEERGALGEAVLRAGASGFGLAIAGGLLRLGWTGPWVAVIQDAGWLLAGASVAGYLADLVRLYRARRRPKLELHNRAAIAAFASLAGILVVSLLLLVTGTFARGAPALVGFALLGWLSGLALTQLYKIVPFLSWLVHFGRKIGRAPVPRVQDLVCETRAIRWFRIYFVGITVIAAGALLRASATTRTGAALSLAATLGLCLEYWRAWRMTYVRPTRSIVSPMSADSREGGF
ncbi:MAG: hypothetical protein ACYCQK_04920 [Acidiferrobacteraceae bacterium]